MIKQIIAEIGSVHDGSIGNALNLISLAKKNGADVVKFQHHLANEEMTKRAKPPPYFKSEKRDKYFERILFSENQLTKIISHCKKINVRFLCSPFSEKSVEILEHLNVDAYKIASGELTNLPLIEKIGKTKKKVYLSTGMSNFKEINEAINVLSKNELIVMQCTSQYPCDIKNVGLNNIQKFKEEFKQQIGFSDHYLGIEAGIAAAALGATVIEKHITFSRSMYGSDAKFALEPEEFKAYCMSIKNVWKMLDNPVNKNNLNSFKIMRQTFQKSIVMAREKKKGEIINKDDIKFKKPGDGIPPKNYKKIIGRILNKNKKTDSQIFFSDLKKS